MGDKSKAVCSTEWDKGCSSTCCLLLMQSPPLFFNAGMTRADRTLVEDLFADGHVQVRHDRHKLHSVMTRFLCTAQLSLSLPAVFNHMITELLVTERCWLWDSVFGHLPTSPVTCVPPPPTAGSCVHCHAGLGCQPARPHGHHQGDTGKGQGGWRKGGLHLGGSAVS